MISTTCNSVMATAEVACYTTAWTIGYVCVRKLLFPHLSADYSNRAISIGHALIAMVMASATIPSIWHPFIRIGGATTPAEVSHHTPNETNWKFRPWHLTSEA